MRVLDELKQGVEEVWGTVAEGWQRLRQQTEGALTRFKSSENNRPASEPRDDQDWRPARWSVLAGDVYEDGDKILVRLEAPGLKKEDFQIEVVGDRLTVRGEKRFEKESETGRYRLLQCAYGAFVRHISLPSTVISEQANASYVDGVLRVMLPKNEASRRRTLNIPVH